MNQLPIPRNLSNALMQVYTPRRSVIIDMVMVQFISIILTMLLILFIQGPTMSSSSVSFYFVGLFLSILMLTGVYSKIIQ
jgi:hypothetical protein